MNARRGSLIAVVVLFATLGTTVELSGQQVPLGPPPLEIGMSKEVAIGRLDAIGASHHESPPNTITVYRGGNTLLDAGSRILGVLRFDGEGLAEVETTLVHVRSEDSADLVRTMARLLQSPGSVCVAVSPEESSPLGVVQFHCYRSLPFDINQYERSSTFRLSSDRNFTMEPVVLLSRVTCPACGDPPAPTP